MLYINKYDKVFFFMTILLDFEGVLYRGNDPIPEGKKIYDEASHSGKKIKILTNTSRISTNQISDLLLSSNIHVNTDNIISGAKMTVNFLKMNQIDSILLFGNESFIEEIREAGINVITYEDHEKKSIEEISLYEKAQSVVIASDQSYDFLRASLATRYIYEKKLPLYCVGRDRYFPSSSGSFIPGPFSLSAAPRVASYIEPIIIGKPNKNSIANLLQDLDPNNTTLIGDNLETDFEFAKEMGYEFLKAE